MSTPKFNVYLIVGDNIRPQTEKLLKDFNIKLSLNSPDIEVIAPLKKEITIGQLRELKRRIWGKPQVLPYRVTIIEQAHTANKEAQNALLKLLEEPPEQSIIILEAANKHTILPTVLSRLVKIEVKDDHGIDDLEDQSFLEKNLEDLLETVSAIDEPAVWLDRQMIILTNLLKKNINSGSNRISVSKITNAIELLKQAKQMIDANVNAKFVLLNLALTLTSTY